MIDTTKIIATFTNSPCTWTIRDVPPNVRPAGSKIGQSPEAAATMSIRGDGSGVTLRCRFAPDDTPDIPPRNLAYLLALATIAGGDGGYQWLKRAIDRANKNGVDVEYTHESKTAPLTLRLTVAYSESMTTLTVRPREDV